jgi:hypothetical protein
MSSVVICQIVLLAYHQFTTLVDLFPFNGARNTTRGEKLAEAATNAVLMSLAPIGYAFQIKALMIYGVVYYFVLFAIELIIWWIPYFCVPSGSWRTVYNRLLSIATSNFDPGDTLDHWIAIHTRVHSGTIGFLPQRAGRIVPNLEHSILHVWTLITAIVTLCGYRGLAG